MILVDANLLIYAAVPSFVQHKAAAGWLSERLTGTAAIGLPWPSLLAYLRIVTDSRILRPPASLADAWDLARDWLAQTPVWVPTPGERHAQLLDEVLPESGGGKLVPDAHLAALAIEHGLTLYSTDRDFARFSLLRWEDPLAPR